MEEKNKEKALDFRKLVITKKLNILIGSGCSSPAIRLMSKTNDKKNPDKEIIEDAIATSDYLFNKKPIASNKAKEIDETKDAYLRLLETILRLKESSNSRNGPKTINIVTTNYDLFIEHVIDDISRTNNISFNDGSSGYFKRYIDSSNYNKSMIYRGINDNYTDELTTINLIKPHGSINWRKLKDEDEIVVINPSSFVKDCAHVPPSGNEIKDVFMHNHFFDMLKLFQLELDKQQSLLLVMGFSFQDKHFVKMLRRALKNKELLVIIFAYTKDAKDEIKENIEIASEYSNLIIYSPDDINKIYNPRIKCDFLTLENITYLLKQYKDEND